MEKMKLRTLILMGSIMPLAAFAEPTFYGKANVVLQSAKEGDVSTSELLSNASRIGVKGSQPIADGLEAIYQAEYEIYVDDGDNGGRTFGQRNIFVGLKGTYGSVIGGHFDTPLKVAQGKVDLFNDLEGDIRNVLTPNDNRESNSVMYTTPSMNGLSFSGALVLSEEEDVADGKSVSAIYSRDQLYLALAFDQDVEAEKAEAIRAIVQYKIASVTVGGMYEESETASNLREEGWLVSALHEWEKWGVRAQYGQSDIIYVDAKTFSVGLDYNLSKAAKTFLYYTKEESDGSEAINDRYLGIGFELSF